MVADFIIMLDKQLNMNLRPQFIYLHILEQVKY